jgi:hypothetical protein
MQTLIQNVVRGADPELFLRDSKTNLPVTSIGLIGGSKDFPRQLGNGYALQEDNVAVEFNIPPASTKDQFHASIAYVLAYLKQELEPQDLVLDISPTMEFDPKQLDNPQAQTLGCDPDYNAWTNEINPKPVAPPTLRSSGGHLHIGYDNPTLELSREIVKVHDLFVSVPSILYDDDMKRRAIYGKAGACRYKSYGVECRTFSNFWLKSEELTKWLYEQSEKAIDFINEGRKLTLEDSRMIVECVIRC